MRQRTKLVHRGGGVTGDLAELVREHRIRCPLARSLELDLDGEQPLLRPVVEVALEAQPLFLSRADNPPARRLQVLNEPGVLEQEHRCRGEPLGDTRGLVERGIVDESRNVSAVALDEGDLDRGVGVLRLDLVRAGRRLRLRDR